MIPQYRPVLALKFCEGQMYVKFEAPETVSLLEGYKGMV